MSLSAFLPAQINNFLCLLITTILNTAANRAFTFGISGRKNAARDQLSGLVIFFVCWSVTSLSLMGLAFVDPNASATTELIVLTLANIVATIIRFVALRAYFYSFRRRHRAENKA
ncbi:hypothetical protein [uncultured Corynebacterium sp.]|uniref:hypothetical protein n=1 Tax=uncultured Corynebacterium sp. TaxID=159447 RepID=UPI0025F68016|nr:hypothetical protein [uncultured Corynebacterium sp.]